MSRKAKLEQDVRLAKERLDNASDNVPREILVLWKKEYETLVRQLEELVVNEPKQA